MYSAAVHANVGEKSNYILIISKREYSNTAQSIFVEIFHSSVPKSCTQNHKIHTFMVPLTSNM